MNSDDQRYRYWLEQRRGQRAGPELTDRIMATVTRTDVSQRASRCALLLMWIDRSGLRRLAASVGALLIGSMPFVYLAYISRAFLF